MRVLTWNLMHGRAVPPAGRELLAEFTAALGGWDWDVALLQEVPPWWPSSLGAVLRASSWRVLTSRNSLLFARRAVARRWPDVIKSNGGGCNAILVRGRGVAQHRVFRLSLWPERRWLHAVRLDDGTWVGNVHCSGDVRQAREAGAVALRWALGAPLILGGDWNVPALELAGCARAGGSGVDQIFVAGGLSADGAPVTLDRPRVPLDRPRVPLDRGHLSDHAPLLVSVIKKPQ